MNASKFTPKRIFPIKAKVIRKNAMTPPTDFYERKAERTLFRDTAPAVGYVHFKFNDMETQEGKKCLNISIGVSFCHPNDFKRFHSEYGKRLAKTIEYNPHACLAHNFEYVEEQRVFRPMMVSSLTTDNKDECYKKKFERFFDLRCNIQKPIARHFEQVTVLLNFNILQKNFTTFKVRGREVKYFFERFMIDQIGDYLEIALKSYLHKRFEEEFVESVNKSDFWDYTAHHPYWGINPYTPKPRIKDGCIILSTKTNMVFRDYTEYSRGKAPKYKIRKNVNVGYVAIKVEGDDFYIGTSYCNPADAKKFKTKFGKRLAFKRMMERYEKGEKNKITCLDKRVILRKNLDIFHFDADTLTSVEYRLPAGPIVYYEYLEANLTEEFCSYTAKEKILTQLKDWVNFMKYFR